MKIELNTLKYAKMLAERGFEQQQASTLIECLVAIDIRNLYSKEEVNAMLSETVEKVFRDQKEKLNEQRRVFDKRMELAEHRTERRIESEIAEARSGRRWVIGTIVTCTFALAGYLSALIHVTH